MPTIRFAAVDSDLYRRILERCVEPGTPCMSQIMAHDRGEMRHMPPRGSSMPQHGKAEGALFKSPREKGAVRNNNRFGRDDAELPATKPAPESEDRNMSALDLEPLISGSQSTRV